MHTTEKINEVFIQFKNKDAKRIEKLQQSGSDRQYFRIFCNEATHIATYNPHVKENQTFIYFSKHFKKAKLPVPQIYAISNDETVYIQQDLGTLSLLDKLEEYGENHHMYNLFKKSLQQLARIQIIGHRGIDYSKCLTAKKFGRQAILSDLLYFKYYFLDTLKLPYDKQALLDDFEALATYLTKTEYKFFMFRDFQSRNIIVNNDEVSFIDYQGGMQGASQYDVASLLW
ncbi:MAG: phosphotransferase, partial [Parafilimonas sp.]